MSCIAFGTEMYLLEWGSFPSRLLSDMMETLPSKTTAYLVKIWKGERLPLGAATPLPFEDTRSTGLVLVTSLLKDEGLSRSGFSAGLRLANAFSEAPRSLRGVSWRLSRILRLKPIYTMDETSGHPRVSDIDLETRWKTKVEVEFIECSCFSWWWLSWSNVVVRPSHIVTTIPPLPPKYVV